MAELDQQDIKDIIDKLVEAIKRGSGSAKDIQKKLLVEAKTVENYRKLNTALETAIKQDAEINKDKIKQKQLLQDLDDEYEAQYKVLRRNRELQEDIFKTNRALVGTLYGLGDASVTGAEKISHYTKSFASFPLFGQAVSDLGNSLDFNIENFRSLASVGADFGQSLIQLRVVARDALLPLKEFTDFIGSETQTIAGLFGSVNQGTVAVSQLARNVRQNLIPQFAGLGLTTENYLDFLGTFLELQRAQGRQDFLSQEQTTAALANYTTTLDTVTKLTGIQRDQLNEAVRRQGADAKFQIFLQGLNRNRQMELQTFVAGLQGINPALADAVKNIVSTGFPLGEFESNLVATGGSLMSNIQALRAGTIDIATFAQGLAGSADAFANKFNPAVLATNQSIAEVGNAFVGFRRNFSSLDEITRQQGAAGDGLTAQIGVTQEAFRKFKSQIEGLQTSFLTAFGPSFAGFLGLTDKTLTGIGSAIGSATREWPKLTGIGVASLLAGKYLFDYATQVGIVAAGTAIGTSKFFPGLNAQIAAQGGMLRMIGTRFLPAAGAVLGVGTALAKTMSDNPNEQKQGAAGLLGAGAGALTGAAIGSVIPGLGTVVGGLIGAGVGSLAQMIPTRSTGGPINPFVPTIVGEAGPELITTTSRGNVLPNSVVSAADTAQNARLQTLLGDQNTTFKQFADISARMEKHLNTLVSISARTEQNTGTATRRLANLSGSLV
jgi:hypothetical protein